MPVLDHQTREYILTDEFATRARTVHQRLEANEPMSLGEIADALGLDFEFFAQQVAAEMMAQDRTVHGVFIEDGEAPPANRGSMQ